MSKSVTKKPKPKQESESVTVHDIINKVKDSQQTLDKKLEELSLMCSGKQCKVK